MRGETQELFRSLLPTALLVALLVLLGTLQVRWLEQARQADQSRSQAVLEGGLQRVAADFNHELGRLFLELQPMRRRDRSPEAPEDLPAKLVELLADWRASADFPGLVAGAYLVLPGNRQATWRLDPGEALAGDPETWPPPIRQLVEGLEHLAARDGEPAAPGGELAPAKIPALVVPLAVPPTGPPEGVPTAARRQSHDENVERRRRERRRSRHPSHRGPRPLVILHLDRQVLLREMIPALVERYFGPGLEFHLSVAERDRPGSILLAIGPSAPADAAIDAEVELFGPLLTERRLSRGRRLAGLPPSQDQGHWLLRASHPAGSLGAAVARAHRRNLALGLGILAVLAASTVLLQRNASRSRRLARQQLDFVAGITHELMTPLAAMRSAGQNLADGVVGQPAQVERYGHMIDREGRRLTDLVGQVLDFARMQSGEPNFRLEKLDPAAELRAVVEDLRPTLDAEGVEIELEIGTELPPIRADSQALRRALGNLISNAVKYGRAPDGRPWIALAAHTSGGELTYEVRDRGPGIDPRDRPHLFEPFFRGRHLAASRVPGSGLGLALVEHLVGGQHGRVTVTSSARGTIFKVHLPLAPETLATETTT